MFQDCLQSLQNIASYSFTLSTSSQFGFVLPLGCRLLQPAQSFCPFLLSFLCTHWMQCHSHTALCAFDCAQHNASRTFERSVKAPSFKLPLLTRDPPKALWLPSADISYSFSMLHYLHSSWALHFLKPSPCLCLLKQSVV